MEVLQVFTRLMYSPAGVSGTSLDQIPKPDQKIVKKLIAQSKKLLLSQNMQMSLSKLDSQGAEDVKKDDQEDQPMSSADAFGCPNSTPIHSLTFSQWLQALVVRPFAPFIPTLVRKVYEALELEDVVIDLDLSHHSNSKTSLLSKKRKLADTSLSTIADSSHDMSHTSIFQPKAFKRRQLKSVLEQQRKHNQMFEMRDNFPKIDSTPIIIPSKKSVSFNQTGEML